VLDEREKNASYSSMRWERKHATDSPECPGQPLQGGSHISAIICKKEKHKGEHVYFQCPAKSTATGSEMSYFQNHTNCGSS